MEALYFPPIFKKSIWERETKYKYIILLFHFVYAIIGCFLYVSRDWTHNLAYWDDALNSGGTQPGLNDTFVFNKSLNYD